MPEIDVDFQQVNTVSTRLTTSNTEIKGTLTRLQTHVTELLTGTGGLWLRQASPVMNDQYTEFNGSLTNLIHYLSTFADSFAKIVQNLQDMDTTLAKPPPTK